MFVLSKVALTFNSHGYIWKVTCPEYKNPKNSNILQVTLIKTIPTVKGPLKYLLRPLLGKNQFAVTQRTYACHDWTRFGQYILRASMVHFMTSSDHAQCHVTEPLIANILLIIRDQALD